MSDLRLKGGDYGFALFSATAQAASARRRQNGPDPTGDRDDPAEDDGEGDGN